MKHIPPERVKCPHCVGTRDSWKQIPQQNTFAQWSYSLCDHCAGQGYVLVSFTTPANRCPVCYGLGYAYAEDFVLLIFLPASPMAQNIYYNTLVMNMKVIPKQEMSW